MQDQSDITPVVNTAMSPVDLITMSRSLVTSIGNALKEHGLMAECTLEMSHDSQRVIMLAISVKALIELAIPGLTEEVQNSRECH